jgi:hypothetical protein
MPTVTKSAQTERVGVLAVGLIIERFGWIWREQTTDYGIDAQVEVVKDGKPSGHLIVLQIKSGASYFKRRGDGYVFSGDVEHLKYWAGHDLAMFLILHNPVTGLTLWQRISLDTAKVRGKRWHITIPANHVLDETAKPYLDAGIPRSEESARRFRFAVDRDLMEQIRNRTTYIEIDVWVNKSLSIREIEIKFDQPKKDPDLAIDLWIPFQYDPNEVMEQFFPWLDYDYAREIEEFSGEIENHFFEVWLTDAAEKYLDVESYFRDGPPEKPPPEPSKEDDDNAYALNKPEW